MLKKNILVAILLIVFIFIGSGILYLNNVYLPVEVKGLLSEGLSEFTHYNVEIGKLKFSLVRGLVVENLAVYDGVKDNTILSIPEASFHILFIPLLKDRKIIIPILNVNSPYFNVRYHQDKTLNLSRAFNVPAKQKDKSKYSFLVYKINILDAKGIFEDERVTPKFTRSIDDLDIVLGIKDLAKISFLIDSKVATSKGTLTALSLRGEYNWMTKELTSKLNLANLLIHEFNPYLKMLPLSIASAAIDTSALEFRFKDKIISLKGALSTKDLEIRKQNIALTGAINIEPDIAYALDKRTLDYKGKIKFVQVGLNGIPYVNKLSNISGDISLEKNKVHTDNLKMQAADASFNMTGAVENFGNPSVRLDFKSEQVNLEKLSAILPFEAKAINVTGTAAVDISMAGQLARLPLDIKANLKLSDCKLQTTSLKDPLTAIKGDVSFTKDNVSWQDLSFNYLGLDYTSTGKVADFKSPQIIASLKSKDLDLKSDLKMQDKILRIITFKGRYINSLFDAEGRVDTQDISNPVAGLSLNLCLNPRDILGFLPAQTADKLKKIKADGIFNIKGTLNGKIKDYKDWSAAFKVSSDTFSIYDFKFKGITFNYIQRMGLINIDRFIASFYGGPVTLSFAADLGEKPATYALELNGSAINLEKLKMDTPLKDEDMAGLFNIEINTRGNFKDTGSIEGSGLFSVKDGRLWQINLFKGLGELFLISDYNKIAFKEAFGEFNIADKAVSIEEFELNSKQLILKGTGNINFDGALDLTFFADVNDSYISDSADIRKFTTAVLGKLGSALVIKVGGTLKEPKHKIVPSAGTLIKNIKDFILGK
ncbi:MAG: AsmA-like C-terminal region-containing protein [Candidatus Omnitrophota bacterium]|jgi:hypothetical protein